MHKLTENLWVAVKNIEYVKEGSTLKTLRCGFVITVLVLLICTDHRLRAFRSTYDSRRASRACPDDIWELPAKRFPQG